MYRYFILLLGVVACATSVIFIKQSTALPEWLTGIRQLVAAIALTPLFVLEYRKYQLKPNPKPLSQLILIGLPGAFFLCVHFITWAMGARLTYAANASLIVNLAPVAMPFVMWTMNHERINRGEVIGTLIALSGVGILVAGHYQFSAENVHGDMVCFVSMLIFCVYLALSRKLGAGRSIWLYIVPLYWFGGLFAIAYSLIRHIPSPTMTLHECLMLLALGIVPTVIGHSSLNWCIKHFRGPVVSTVNVGQFAVAGVLAWWFLNKEKPELLFYPTCILIVVGVIIVIRASPAPKQITSES